MYYEEGLNDVPDIVKAETKQYLHDNDYIQQFLDEQCKIDKNGCVASNNLYNKFKEVMPDVEYSQRTFSNKMVQKGFKMGRKRIDNKQERIFLGLSFC